MEKKDENGKKIEELLHVYYDMLKSQIRIYDTEDGFYEVVLPEDEYVTFRIKREVNKYTIVCIAVNHPTGADFSYNVRLFEFVDKFFGADKVKSLHFEYSACVVEV